MRNTSISGELGTENQNTHFVFNNFPPSPENLSDHELMWRNNVESGRPQTTILRTRN